MTREDSIHEQSQGAYKGGGFDKTAKASEPVKPTLETIYAKHAGEVVKAGAPAGNKNAAGPHKPGDVLNVHGNDYKILTVETPESHRAKGREHTAQAMEAVKQSHDFFAVKPQGNKVHTFARFGSGNFTKPAPLHMTMADPEIEQTITEAKADYEKHNPTAKAAEPTSGTATSKKPSLETIFAKRPKLTLETIYARGVNGQPAGRN
jgi:hypothetical protein